MKHADIIFKGIKCHVIFQKIHAADEGDGLNIEIIYPKLKNEELMEQL